jgi:hypothetical protein
LRCAAIAGLSEVIFIGLVLVYGRAYLGTQADLAVVLDPVTVPVFAGYLAGSLRRQSEGR